MDSSRNHPSKYRALGQPAFGAAVRCISSGLAASRVSFYHPPHCYLVADSEQATTRSSLNTQHCEVGVVDNISHLPLSSKYLRPHACLLQLLPSGTTGFQKTHGHSDFLRPCVPSLQSMGSVEEAKQQL